MWQKYWSAHNRSKEIYGEISAGQVTSIVPSADACDLLREQTVLLVWASESLGRIVGVEGSGPAIQDARR